MIPCELCYLTPCLLILSIWSPCVSVTFTMLAISSMFCLTTILDTTVSVLLSSSASSSVKLMDLSEMRSSEVVSGEELILRVKRFSMM